MTRATVRDLVAWISIMMASYFVGVALKVRHGREDGRETTVV